MSVYLYTGLTGAGKTYECLRTSILPALKKGQRVVTNLEGINKQAFFEYLDIDCENLIVAVDVNAPSLPDFHYTPTHPNTVVQPGDLVVLDEVWRFYKKGEKLPSHAMEFFREHRKSVEDFTGNSIDIALICQDKSVVHPEIKGLIDETYHCVNLKNVGLSNGYIVKKYLPGMRPPTSEVTHFYDKSLFKLYQSQRGAFKKKSRDGRTSLFTSPKFISMVVVSLLAPYFVYQSVQAVLGNKGGVIGAVSASTPTSTSTPTPTPTPTSTPPTSPTGAIVSMYKVGELSVVVLYNPATKRYTTLTNPPTLAGAGDDVRIISPPP